MIILKSKCYNTTTLQGTTKSRYNVDIITINADKGVENSSSRTQFIKRRVEFADKSNKTINLAYYPPYHSKYNPVERVWGVYENHINRDIMDTIETTLKFAESMTYNGKKPVIKFVEKIYKTGTKVRKKQWKNIMSLLNVCHR